MTSPRGWCGDGRVGARFSQFIKRVRRVRMHRVWCGPCRRDSTTAAGREGGCIVDHRDEHGGQPTCVLPIAASTYSAIRARASGARTRNRKARPKLRRSRLAFWCRDSYLGPLLKASGASRVASPAHLRRTRSARQARRPPRRDAPRAPSQRMPRQPPCAAARRQAPRP
jgi:hypothetical protein